MHYLLKLEAYNMHIYIYILLTYIHYINPTTLIRQSSIHPLTFIRFYRQRHITQWIKQAILSTIENNADFINMPQS